MLKIPNPEILLEIARSAQCQIVDREWKKYQRYLTKFDQIDRSTDEKPLSFESYCDTLRKKRKI